MPRPGHRRLVIWFFFLLFFLREKITASAFTTKLFHDIIIGSNETEAEFSKHGQDTSLGKHRLSYARFSSVDMKCNGWAKQSHNDKTEHTVMLKPEISWPLSTWAFQYTVMKLHSPNRVFKHSTRTACSMVFHQRPYMFLPSGEWNPFFCLLNSSRWGGSHTQVRAKCSAIN